MKHKNLIGYLTGFLLFIVLIPFGMRKVSGKTHSGRFHRLFLVCFAVLGIGLSIWSIVYMRKVGKGNPMDAFNHEVGPRTSNLMTGGPYRLCRNPMLLGVFLYYLGLLVCFFSPAAVIIFALFAGIMMVQVSSEEKRLEQDFGEAYQEYKAKTKKIIPFVW